MSRRIWAVYLVVNLAAILLSIRWNPMGDGGRLLLFVEGASPLVIAAAARRTAWRKPWYLVALGVAGFWAGNLAFRLISERTGNPDPFPSLADAFYYPGYLGMAAGAILLIRRRSRRRDWATLVDSLIVAAGVGLVVWSFVMAPYARQGRLPMFDRGLSIGYSVLDIVLVGVWARMAVGPGSRNPSYYFFGSAFVMILVTDMLVTMATAGAYSGALIPVFSALCFVACGTGALHPSMDRLRERDDSHSPRLTRRRLGLLALALAMPTGVLVAKAVTGHHVDATTVVTGAFVMAALVLARMTILLRANERKANRERILREAGLALVAATSKEEMHEGALSAVLALAGQQREVRASLATLDASVTAEPSLRVVASVGFRGVAAVRSVLRIDAAELENRLPHTRHDVRPIDLDDDDDERGSVVTLPLVSQNELRGAIVVTSPAPIGAETIQSLTDFVSAVALALESAALTESLHRRKSERRFKALIEHSTDMVTVVGPDGITFASPSSSRVLGVDPAALLGASPLELVHPEDVPAALALFATGGTKAEPVVVRMRHADGSFRSFELVATNLTRDPEVGGVVLNARDITERRQTEERFRSLVQNSSDVVSVAGEDGAFTFMSPAVTRVLGYEPAELLGRPFDELVHPEDLIQAAELTRSFTRSEVRVRHADGSWHTLDVTCTDLRTEPSVQGIVFNARDVSDRKALEGELRFQALHDSLTGLANRALFADRVEHALRRRSDRPDMVAVVFIDLDDFKTINDSLGHVAGDELLVQLSERLRGCLREGDTPARLGGDEFAVLVEDIYSEEQVVALAQRIKDEVLRPFEIDGRSLPLPMTASIGIAIDEARASSAQVLLRNADAAMYLAKERGKGRWEIFEESTHEVVFERMELKADMAQALADGDFTAHYQPIVSLATGELTGVEALLRWNHATRGSVRPDAFIPLAELTGFIVPLGRWVLDQACAQLRQWRDEFPTAPAFTMSVNLSVRQLEDPALVEDVRTTLARHGLSPEDLTLEITESILVTDTDATTMRLEQLRALGVRLALDDFGTGYSSLGYLSRLPIDVVKLDRSFVAGVGVPGADVSVIEGVVRLAHGRGLSLVAEGIETEGQLAVLTALSCDFGQGFHFSRPQPPQEISRRLREALALPV